MRHNQKKKHLGRTPSHRKAMLSNLVTSLFENGRIRTTQAKAKEGRKLAEKLITFAKKGELNDRRQVLKTVRNKSVVKRLFDEIGPRFAERRGGYTRMVKLGTRLGDRASMVLLELMDEPEVAGIKDEKKKKEKASKEKKTAKAVSNKEKGTRRTKKKSAKEIKKAPSPAIANKKAKVKKQSSKKAPQA
ncbi:50S ribosomal protein L17 [bacterium]|nr:50S ribosomal protein L17 [bacterium]